MGTDLVYYIGYIGRQSGCEAGMGILEIYIWSVYCLASADGTAGTDCVRAGVCGHSAFDCCAYPVSVVAKGVK